MPLRHETGTTAHGRASIEGSAVSRVPLRPAGDNPETNPCSHHAPFSILTMKTILTSTLFVYVLATIISFAVAALIKAIDRILCTSRPPEAKRP